MRTFKNTHILTAIFTVIGLATAFTSEQKSTRASTKKPNVILIYADDLGAGMLGINGQEIIQTPHIDKLAKSGMQFTKSYGCIYCAPARASLITGLHSSRANAWKITRGGKVIEKDEGKISEEEFQKCLKNGRPAKKGEVFLA